jgi:hypothetical protein
MKIRRARLAIPPTTPPTIALRFGEDDPVSEGPTLAVEEEVLNNLGVS